MPNLLKRALSATIYLTVLLLLTPVLLIAQQKISGVIQDSNQKPLKSATLQLLRQQTKSFVKSTLSNESGHFQFAQIDTGSYLLIISHTGFTEQQQTIRVDGKEVTVPTILLVPAAATMQGVTVTAKKPLIEQTEDKVIFNVDSDPSAKAESALDLLRKVPFVSVDGDGNVMLNGQTNFKVLLNGKETAMFARNVKEALRGLPGAIIVKIEVITSPSAKYDGEGVGGIINIITAKKVIGYNGVIGASYNTARLWSANGSFNAKFGKVGVSLSTSLNGVFNQPGTVHNITTPKTTSFYSQRISDRKSTNSSNFSFLNGEVSYEVDSLNTFSTYANIFFSSQSNTGEQRITTDFASAPSIITDLIQEGEVIFPTNTVGLDYIRKFKNHKDREFSIRTNAELSGNQNESKSFQTHPNGNRYLLNESDAKNKQYTFQCDYIHPLANNKKLETGVKAILRRAGSDFQSLVRYDLQQPYKIDPSNTNNFRYSQDIFSVYGSYNFKLKQTALRIGMRVEQTTIDGDFTSSNTVVKQSYTSYLPNLQSTFKLNKVTQLTTNYTIRIQRPFIWSLNPYINNLDTLNISYGNPDLGPQTIHTFTAQTRINKGKVFTGITFQGSYTNNRIIPFTTFDPATGITKTTSMNIGREWVYGLSFNITARIDNDWSVFANGNIRYNDINNRITNGASNKSFGGFTGFNVTYKFNKLLTGTVYGGLNRNNVTLQSKVSLNYWSGINLTQKLFKEKLNLFVQLANFTSKNFDFITTQTDINFTSVTTSTFPYRGLNIGLSWNFGKLQENLSKKKGVTTDDTVQ